MRQNTFCRIVRSKRKSLLTFFNVLVMKYCFTQSYHSWRKQPFYRYTLTRNEEKTRYNIGIFVKIVIIQSCSMLDQRVHIYTILLKLSTLGAVWGKPNTSICINVSIYF